VTATDILHRVSKARGVPVKRILEKNKKASVTRARQEAIYLIRRHTKLSSPEVGRILRRDHSTVLHDEAVVGFLAMENEDYAAELEAIVTPMTFAMALFRS